MTTTPIPSADEYRIVDEALEKLNKPNLALWSIALDRPSIYNELDKLQKRIEYLESQIEEVHVARDLPDNVIESLIKIYAESLPKSEAIYPSDIAFEYSLDPEKVEQIMDKMVEDGYFE
jgi:hypothetical protein